MKNSELYSWERENSSTIFWHSKITIFCKKLREIKKKCGKTRISPSCFTIYRKNYVLSKHSVEKWKIHSLVHVTIYSKNYVKSKHSVEKREIHSHVSVSPHLPQKLREFIFFTIFQKNFVKSTHSLKKRENSLSSFTILLPITI